MKPLLLLAMISTLLAACAENEKSKADLALACQLNTCICAGPDKLFVKQADPEPVQWKENGDAYCPEGLKLKLANEKRN